MGTELEHQTTAKRYQAKADELKVGIKKTAMQQAADAHGLAAKNINLATKLSNVADCHESAKGPKGRLEIDEKLRERQYKAVIAGGMSIREAEMFSGYKPKVS